MNRITHRRIPYGDGFIEASVYSADYASWVVCVPDPRKKTNRKAKFWARGGSVYGRPISMLGSTFQHFPAGMVEAANLALAEAMLDRKVAKAKKCLG